MEGGIGDFLCASRFLRPLKEKYPHANLTLFSNTDGNQNQANLLTTLYPNYFDVVRQVTRTSQNYKIKSQFGEEIYNAAYDNIIESDRKIIEKADLVINLHLDSLKFLHEIPNWRNYFYHFEPVDGDMLSGLCSQEIYDQNFEDQKYIVCHLSAREGGSYELESWYRDKLIKTLERELPSDYSIHLICQKDRFQIYNNVISDRVKVIDGSLIDIFWIIKHSQQFIGVDSGLRYMALMNAKPAWVFSKYCSAPGQVAHSHLIRWLLFSQYVLPNHHDINLVVKNITNTLEHPAYSLYPNLPPPIENYIVERKFLI